MKRKEINKMFNKLIHEEFDGFKREDVTALDIAEFMFKVNKLLQEVAHDKIENKSFEAHVARFSYKNSIRELLLKRLHRMYPDEVFNYLFTYIKENRRLKDSEVSE